MAVSSSRRPAARVPDAPTGGADLRVVLAAIERVERKQDRILALLEGRHRQPDPDRDVRLLSAIAFAFGNQVFTAAELVAVSDAELRAAVGDVSTRVAGAWLKRLHVHPIAPYRLQQEGRDERGRLWTIKIADVSPLRHTAAGAEP